MAKFIIKIIFELSIRVEFGILFKKGDKIEL